MLEINVSNTTTECIYFKYIHVLMINSSLTAAYRTMQLSDTISGCHMSKKSNFTDISKLTHGGYVLYSNLLDEGLYYLGQK